jgi:hypothetical protein
LARRHLINAKTFAKTPNVYCLSSTCETVAGTCLTTDTFEGPWGRRMLVTSMSLAQVRDAQTALETDLSQGVTPFHFTANVTAGSW